MLNNKNKHNNEERRNYYRTLNVQPDASLEIIKNNYRTLLQKLKLHPDLGGKNWNASIINEAYNILRKPSKRAAYDKKLLQRYDLKLLARGHLDSHPKHQDKKSQNKDKHGNQRNFYRLFNIQSDSPAHIIKTSYLTLFKDPDTPKALLKEAYTILSNPDKRALYDKLLSHRSHAYALKKLTTKQNKSEDIKSKNIVLSQTLKIKPSHINSTLEKTSRHSYKPVITQYCSFCKTPHDQSPCEQTAGSCNECKSPLFPPSKAFLEQQRRDIVRLAKDHHIQFYAYWPGNKHIGTIADISPTGMQLVSTTALNKDQIIKLDAEDFKAVGIVSYNKSKGADSNELQVSGIQFLTVNFNKRKGQFFSESA